MKFKDTSKEAIEIMIGWLSHENELGKAPAKIEVAGEFDYDDNHYYILKYKEGIFSKWKVAVCGFDENGEDCGHTFSEFEPYNEKDAQEKCIAMIEYLKEYWRQRFLGELERRGVTEEEYENMTEEEWQAKGEEADEKAGGGKSLGFILLKNTNFDFKQVITELKKQWDITPEDYKLTEDNLVFELDDNLIALSLVDAPIPEGEAEHFAQGNYMWPEAVETTKKHQAQLMVMVINREGDSLEASFTFSMLVSCCLNQKSVLGIYASGTVFQPEFYKEMTGVMKNGELPVPLWVYVGLVKGEKGNGGYTYGMNTFGKMDMEVLDSKHSFQEIQSFLYYVAEYVIKTNMIFRDGETLSFTSDERLKITKSDAVYLDGESIKIWF